MAVGGVGHVDVQGARRERLIQALGTLVRQYHDELRARRTHGRDRLGLCLGIVGEGEICNPLRVRRFGRVRAGEADHPDLHAIRWQDCPRLRELHLLARGGAAEVRGEERKLGLRESLCEHLAADVELVVPDGRGVAAHGVERRHHRLPLEPRRNGRSGPAVAATEEQIPVGIEPLCHHLAPQATQCRDEPRRNALLDIAAEHQTLAAQLPQRLISRRAGHRGARSSR